LASKRGVGEIVTNFSLMEQEFIIDGTPVKVSLSFMHLEQLLLDVTSFGDAVRNYISSGIRIIRFEGITNNKQKISGTFLIVNQKDNILILKSLKG
jgi:hypothetical protein